ncbi:hypothetical protein ACEQ8H_003203 [Pleosporales sp. CAS-2024a]
MDASTRLYTRLGEIPQDPSDPESLAELLVCAFGAFQRGGYRQDGYDLPPLLKAWLYPSDGTTHDFATLQVVFGRGEEYFASDKDGKLEFKDTDVKKPGSGGGGDEDEKDKSDKPPAPLRRARTVSFLRPLSDSSTRSEGDSTESRRSSGVSSRRASRRASRPPSLSYSNSRTSSVASMSEDLDAWQAPVSGAVSQWDALRGKEAATERSMKRSSRLIEQSFAQSIDEERGRMESLMSAQEQKNMLLNSKIMAQFSIPEGYMLIPIETAGSVDTSAKCTCGCHTSPLLRKNKPSYVDDSMQTDEILLDNQKALRIDTLPTAPHPLSTSYTATPQSYLTPTDEGVAEENPIFMGRMMNYFSRPSYQLGDSLVSGYQVYEPIVYQYQDEFGDEVMHIR